MTFNRPMIFYDITEKRQKRATKWRENKERMAEKVFMESAKLLRERAPTAPLIRLSAKSLGFYRAYITLNTLGQWRMIDGWHCTRLHFYFAGILMRIVLARE